MFSRTPVVVVVAACTLACVPDAPDDNLEIVVDPAPDFERSPYTGWTRAHYVALFGRLLDGWSQRLTPGGARSRFGGNDEYPEQLEGVTRMLPALGAWLANPGNPRVVSYAGRTHDVFAYARNMLLNGTDPDHAEYWGPIGDPGGQARVEATFVSEFLIQTRPHFWDELEDQEREQLMTWLSPSSKQYGNNWQLLTAVSDATRREFGYSIDDDLHLARLNEYETHSLGDGWFRDGEDAEVDGYNGYVIHSEWLWWAQIEGDADPARRERVHRRVRAWLHHLPWLIASDGATPAIGRSLIYRSAWLAPLALATRFDVSPLEPGVSRRILSANLAWHLGDDPLADERMLDADDVLRPGYVDDDPNALEAYQNPGAQYLMTRALSVLALPEDHAFWTATEAELPADAGDFDHAIPRAGFHVQHRGGIVVLDNTLGFKDWFSHQPRHAKLAYASHLPFTSGTPPGTAGIDAMVLPSPDSQSFAGRLPSRDVSVVDGYAGTRYFTHGPSGIVPDEPLGYADEVRTAVLAFSGGRVRLTCVSPSASAPVWFHEGTFSTSAEFVDTGLDPEGTWAYAETPDAAVAFAVLFGYDPPQAPAPWLGEGHRNLVHPSDAVITTRSSEIAGLGSTCAASVHLASLDGFDPAAPLAAIEDWSFEGNALTLDLDDAGRAWANVEREPTERELVLDDITFSGPLRYAREQPGRRAAAGLTRVEGGGLPDFESTGGPTTYACNEREGLVHCLLGGPGVLRTPDGAASNTWSIELVAVDGTTQPLSVDADPDIELDEERFDDYVSANELSQLLVRLRPQ